MKDIKELLLIGKSKGFINYLDLKEYLPVEIKDKKEIVEDIIQMFNDMGIEIRYEKAEIIRIYPGSNNN